LYSDHDAMAMQLLSESKSAEERMQIQL
jgi:hypothetical protein